MAITPEKLFVVFFQKIIFLFNKIINTKNRIKAFTKITNQIQTNFTIDEIDEEYVIHGKAISFKKIIQFNFESDEREFSFYILRLNWLREDVILEKDKNKIRNRLIKYLIYFYDFEIYKKINDTYTYSECIVNIISIIEFVKKESLSKNELIFLEKVINNFLTYVSNNIEIYYNGKFNNHILCNIRSLIIGKSYLRLNFLENSETLKKILVSLIDDEGFLKEGSSFYQLIVSKWIKELLELVEYDVENINLKNYLLQLYNIMIDKVVFLSYKSKEDIIKIVHFGDVSPDFKQKILLKYLGNFNLSYSIEGYFEFKSYLRCNYGNKYLFMRKSINNHINEINHEHSDLFHFIVVDNGEVIFDDVGTSSYLNNNIRKDKFGNSHNTLLKNGKGLLILRNEIVFRINPYKVVYEINKGFKNTILKLIYYNNSFKWERYIKINKFYLSIKDDFNDNFCSLNFIINTKFTNKIFINTVSNNFIFKKQKLKVYYDYGVGIDASQFKYCFNGNKKGHLELIYKS